MKRTKTKGFGSSNRESHDASEFYSRKIYKESMPPLTYAGIKSVVPAESVLAYDGWQNTIYNCSSEHMKHIPDNSIGLAFTSPPYNVGKNYELDLSMEEYLSMIGRVAKEVFRVLVPGGRYVVNVANLGRKPFIPMHAYFYATHQSLGFTPVGEIVWQKGDGMSGNCAWGSWRSAKSPSLRDLHEYLLVFAKDVVGRPDRGVSDIDASEFMSSTLSVWKIPPESAKKVGHPAPFPLALADRVVHLYSYVDDVILDPFCGSGTTCSE